MTLWCSMPVDDAITPGSILRDEFLSPLKLGVEEAAASIGLPLARLAALIRGEERVDVEMALLLGRRFGTSCAFWLNLQGQVDRAAFHHEPHPVAC